MKLHTYVYSLLLSAKLPVALPIWNSLFLHFRACIFFVVICFYFLNNCLFLSVGMHIEIKEYHRNMFSISIMCVPELSSDCQSWCQMALSAKPAFQICFFFRGVGGEGSLI